MSRALVAPLVAAVALAAGPASASARTADGVARLEGQFRLTGQVTAAEGVPGERVGKKVIRTWMFTPGCQAGACASVGLVRTRAHGSDRLVLHRQAPGYYIGHGSFYAPVRCGGRTYQRGEKVPFRITARVTATTKSSGTVIATRLKASYRNRSRTNLTPCVATPSHDAAKYRGQLVSGGSPSGGAGP